MISALAYQYITGLSDPENIENVKNELFSTNDPQVRKGSLIGLGLASNPTIHESETADEHILGLLELNGESLHLGYILSIVGQYN